MYHLFNIEKVIQFRQTVSYIIYIGVWLRVKLVESLVVETVVGAALVGLDIHSEVLAREIVDYGVEYLVFDGAYVALVFVDTYVGDVNFGLGHKYHSASENDFFGVGNGEYHTVSALFHLLYHSVVGHSVGFVVVGKKKRQALLYVYRISFVWGGRSLKPSALVGLYQVYLVNLVLTDEPVLHVVDVAKLIEIEVDAAVRFGNVVDKFFGVFFGGDFGAVDTCPYQVLLHLRGFGVEHRNGHHLLVVGCDKRVPGAADRV